MNSTFIGPGTYRTDGSDHLNATVMTLNACVHPAVDATGGQPPAPTIRVVITEKVPLLDGRMGCDVEVKLTPVQAAQFASNLYQIAREAGALDDVASH